MNKEEIKKALKACAICNCCSQCPYDGKSECYNKVSSDALKLIKAQEAEIAILKDDPKDENSDLLAEYRKKVLEEFVDKLKGRFHSYYPSVDTYCISTEAISYADINKALKEFN